jgi:hypothetical protein
MAHCSLTTVHVTDTFAMPSHRHFSKLTVPAKPASIAILKASEQRPTWNIAIKVGSPLIQHTITLNANLCSFVACVQTWPTFSKSVWTVKSAFASLHTTTRLLGVFYGARLASLRLLDASHVHESKSLLQELM